VKNNYYENVKVINLTTGEIFNSLTEAGYKYSVGKQSIYNACTGVCKKASKCEWSYYGEYLDEIRDK
jgi:hypothetical protein